MTHFYKRALAFLLGLSFFYFSAAAQETAAPFSGDVFFDIGTLWVDDSGTSCYWRGGTNFVFSGSTYLIFDFFKASSDLHVLNTTVYGLSGEVGFDIPIGNIELKAGYLNHSALTASINEITLSSDGGVGSYVSIKTPLRLGIFSITPLFISGSASWNEGELYWFFGKPSIPDFHIFGLDIGIDVQDSDRHSLGTRFFNIDFKIVNNNEEHLYKSPVDGFLIFYQFLTEHENIYFSGKLGWFYSKNEGAGSLDTSNQPYFLFPYHYYNVETNMEINGVFAAVNFQYKQRVFLYNAELGIIHLLSAHAEMDMHYLNKVLFGGKEVFEKKDIDLAGLGAAFLTLKASIPQLIKTQKMHFSLGIQKRFLIPWGFEKLQDTDGSSAVSENDSLSVVKSILLSGLSLNLSLNW